MTRCKHFERRKQQDMNHPRKLLQQMFGLTFVLLLLAGCGGAQIAPTATPALPTATPIPPTATLTAATTPTPGPLTAATVIAARGDKEWDYVVLGDSFMWRLMPRYAAHLERDLGIEIIQHDRTWGGEHSSHLLNRLRTVPKLRRDIREAEVVIFNIGFAVFKTSGNIYVFRSPGACGGPDNQDCLREALKVYKADTDAIIAEIVSLRSPSEALIRTMTIYQPMVKELKAAGAFEVINTYTQDANEHVIQVASEHHIPVARVYAAFMGPNGDEDPMDKGYVYDDHPTEEGADLMAELFRELGYEYAPPEP
jgi:hypothetical protein